MKLSELDAVVFVMDGVILDDIDVLRGMDHSLSGVLLPLSSGMRRRAEQELHGAFLDWYQAEQEWRAREKRRAQRVAAAANSPDVQA